MKRWRMITAVSIALMARAASGAETIDVTVDKGTLVRLGVNAKIVLVAQPRIADAVVESPRLIFVLGRRPGVTNLFVLDAAQRVIIEADIVVHPNGPRYVTVHRRTRKATLSCAPRCATVATPGEPSRRGRASTASRAPPAAKSPIAPAK